MRLTSQQAEAIQQRRVRMNSVLGHAPGKAPPKPKPMKKPAGKREAQPDLLAVPERKVVNIGTKRAGAGKESAQPGKPVVHFLTDAVTRFDITPVPKPRQTQSDRWKQRPCVVRYREFKDQIKAVGLDVPETGCRLIFVLAMPKSWSKKKRAQMDGQPHKQRPDTDNMIKAVLDAVHTEDSQIHHVEGLKFWGQASAIIVQKTSQAIRLEGEQVIWQQ